MSNSIHYRRIGLLIALAALVQAWVVVHNAVPAQDAVNFIQFAPRMGADALSDSTYLLFMLTGIWGCSEFLRSRRISWLFVAGLAAGIGFLARPEALLLPASLAATLVLMQCRREWRMGWSRM